MAARKLLYPLRRPVKVGYAAHLFPDRTSASPQDELTIVFLEEATLPDVSFPGRSFVLSGSAVEKDAGSTMPVISYDDLLNLILEADSTMDQ